MPEIQLSRTRRDVPGDRRQDSRGRGCRTGSFNTRWLMSSALDRVSANQMVRTLADAGWLKYTPYKGVELTPLGRQRALRILRHRRLWQVFLVEQIGYSSDEASGLACRLEHTLPPEAAERLACWLGQPEVAPDGHPIPSQGADCITTHISQLGELKPNQTASIVELPQDAAARSFLEAQGLRPNESITVLGINSQGDLLLRDCHHKLLHLNHEVADSILVSRAPGEPET